MDCEASWAESRKYKKGFIKYKYNDKNNLLAIFYHCVEKKISLNK